MPPLVVLAYPALTPEDHAWIQSFRAQHDELYFKLVDPHFTFVFPESSVGEAELIAHIREKTRGVPRIAFTVRCAVVVDDATNPYWHVFLVPDEGFSDIVKLHDRLYEGILAPELRLDIPFIPHIGISTSRDSLLCKALADEVNAAGLSIAGSIERLDIVALEPDRVRTIESIELA